MAQRASQRRAAQSRQSYPGDPDAEARGEEGAGRLFAYLHKLGGISMPHTSASGMGTDFRDSDPSVEPVVEVYRGYRSNFETLGAPRSPTAKESARFSAGFVCNAWAKGIKLGVQASSDHVSTHMSYAGFYVDRIDRDSILAAIKSRRSFAATDNLLVELRAGRHFMGESFASATKVPLSVFVSGTGPLERIEVIRNNRVVYSTPGAGAEKRFVFDDSDGRPETGAGYYVRAIQKNGQLCWSSPIWIERPQ